MKCFQTSLDSFYSSKLYFIVWSKFCLTRLFLRNTDGTHHRRYTPKNCSCSPAKRYCLLYPLVVRYEFNQKWLATVTAFHIAFDGCLSMFWCVHGFPVCSVSFCIPIYSTTNARTGQENGSLRNWYPNIAHTLLDTMAGCFFLGKISSAEHTPSCSWHSAHAVPLKPQ